MNITKSFFPRQQEMQGRTEVRSEKNKQQKSSITNHIVTKETLQIQVDELANHVFGLSTDKYTY